MRRGRRLSDGERRTRVVRRGIIRRSIGDLYHFLLNCSWLYLLIIGLMAFVTANALFALAYLGGNDSIKNARPDSFTDAFFFSVQTMMTIGYGTMAPGTLYANILALLRGFAGVKARK